MSSVVADTHAVLWYFAADPHLSPQALDAFEAARLASGCVYLPTICLVEMTYLVEKKRIGHEALARTERAILDSESLIQPVELTTEIARTVRRIPRESEDGPLSEADWAAVREGDAALARGECSTLEGLKRGFGL